MFNPFPAFSSQIKGALTGGGRTEAHWRSSEKRVLIGRRGRGTQWHGIGPLRLRGQSHRRRGLSGAAQIGYLRRRDHTVIGRGRGNQNGLVEGVVHQEGGVAHVDLGVRWLPLTHLGGVLHVLRGALRGLEVQGSILGGLDDLGAGLPERSEHRGGGRRQEYAGPQAGGVLRGPERGGRALAGPLGQMGPGRGPGVGEAQGVCEGGRPRTRACHGASSSSSPCSCSCSGPIDVLQVVWGLLQVAGD